jgi:serine/threonine-protein kinase RsbW
VSQISSLQVRTDLAELSQILSWFEQLKPDSISLLIWMQCQTALAEGFTNAVRHAHKGRSPNTPIQIEVAILADQLEIRIWDFGTAFDLKQQLEIMPDLAASMELGGRGLKLIERMADQLHYIRDESDRNCLIFIKHY